MIYKLLGMIAMIPGTYAMLRGVGMVVTMEHPRRYAGLGTLICTAVWMINHLVLAQPTVVLELFNCVAVVGLACIYVSREQYVQVILTITILQILQMLIIMLTTSAAIYAAGADPIRATAPVDYLYPVMCLIGSVVTIPAMYAAGRLMSRVIPKFRLNLNYLWFVSIPVSQTLLMNVAARPAFNIESYSGFPAALLLCIPLCIASDAASVVVYRKLRNLESLKVTVEQAEKAIDDQTRHYNNLQSQILAVNQIRHDLNNQLQTARYLLQQGDAEEASRQLDLLETAVQKRVGPAYSDNLVVDAVLSVKAEECSRQGIRLETSMVLPRDLNIENAHLCSLFSNLLDNSIQGILAAGSTDGVIRLRSDVQGGYLTVVCSNPAVDSHKKKSRDVLRQHGLGMEILESLARKYQGHMESELKDGIYTTRISLKNPQ